MYRLIATTIILLIINVLTTEAQSPLVFRETTWDFGTIRETDGPVSHRFICRNESERPEVILHVVTTCGCTSSEYTRRPILPGETAEISVVYDPTDRPGSFSKEATVFLSDRRIAARLRVSGQVSGREKTAEELYPVDCGNGLRLSDNFHAFTYIYNGRTTIATIGYANLSDRSIHLELRPRQASGLLRADYPRTIAPGERGTLTFSYTLDSDHPSYGTLRELLTVCIDGCPSPIDLFLHGFAVDAPDPEAQEKAPKWQVNKNIINFGSLKRTDTPAEQTLTLSNHGRSTLTVKAVELPTGVSCTLRPGDRIAPGEKREATVSFDPQKQDYGIWTDKAVLIADDFVRPVLSVRLTAIVEE